MAKKTIILENHSNVVKEYTVAGIVTPGMLVEIDSDGKIQAHSNAGQNAFPRFVIEDEHQGLTINDNYAVGDKAQVWIPNRGDVVFGILADEEDVAIGDFVESNGAGYLRKHEADSAGVVEYPNAIVGQVLEAKDLLGSSGESSSATIGYNKRIQIEII